MLFSQPVGGKGCGVVCLSHGIEGTCRVCEPMQMGAPSSAVLPNSRDYKGCQALDSYQNVLQVLLPMKSVASRWTHCLLRCLDSV